MSNLWMAVVIFLAITVGITAVVLIVIRYKGRIRVVPDRFELNKFLATFFQGFVLGTCIIILSLTSATFIFYYVFPYAGKITPIAYIIVFQVCAMAGSWILLGKSGIFDNAFKPETAERNQAVKKLLVFNLVIVLITSGLSLAAVAAGKHECEKLINKLRGQGLPVSMMDLETPEPAGKNAAPLFQKLTGSFADKKSTVYMDRELFSVAGYPDAYMARDWTAGQKQVIRKFTENSRYLAGFKNIIRDSDYLRYDTYHSVTQNPMLVDYPDISFLFLFCKEISMEAGLDALEGKPDKALALNAVIAKAARYSSQQKTLFANMSALSCIKYGLETVYTMVNTCDADFSFAVRAAQEYEYIEKHSLAVDGMKHELAMGVELYRWVNSSQGYQAIPDLIDFLMRSTGMSHFMFLGILRGKAALAHGSEIFNESESAGRLSIWPNLFGQVTMSGYPWVYEKEIEYRFRLKLADILMAARKFYLKKRVFPDQPTELIGYGLNAGDIIDPFRDDKGPVRFKTVDKGLIIYSVGTDKADDSGNLSRDAGCVLWK